MEDDHVFFNNEMKEDRTNHVHGIDNDEQGNYIGNNEK